MKVFVYGTLRTGDCRFGVNSFVEMIAPEAYIDGFEMLDLGGFPGLVKSEGDGRTTLPKIRGEVHEYEHLRILDGIEGYRASDPTAGHYNRIQVTVKTPDGEIENCWVYTLNGRPLQLRHYNVIESGDWFVHRGHYKNLEGQA